MTKNVLRRRYSTCAACGAKVEIRNGVLSRHRDLFAPAFDCLRSGKAPEIDEGVKLEDALGVVCIVLAIAMYMAGGYMFGAAP